MTKENRVNVKDVRPKFAHVKGVGLSALVPLDSYENGLRELIESLCGNVQIRIVDMRWGVYTPRVEDMRVDGYKMLPW
ncbi:MAG TPA: hypothetical protein EYP33_03005 [Pyrodictium sp.]|nr:hypothetical protein [Pyrodictium sp.]